MKITALCLPAVFPFFSLGAAGADGRARGFRAGGHRAWSQYRDGRNVVHMHIHNSGGSFLCGLAKRNGESVTEWPNNCNLRRREGRFTDGPFSKLSDINATCQDRVAEMLRQSVTLSMVERWIQKDAGDWCPGRVVNTVVVRHPVLRGKSTTNRNFRSNHSRVLGILQHAQKSGLPVNSGWLSSHAAFSNTMIRLLNGVEVMRLPIGGVGRAHLEEAKKMLQGFDVVIDMDNLFRDFVQFEYALGWHMFPSPSKAKVKQSPQVSPELLAALTSLNDLDIELYEYAKGLALEKTRNATKMLV